MFSENFNNEGTNNFFSENSIMCDPNHPNQTSPISPHMSATALLQKASRVGSTSSNNNNNVSSLTRNIGVSSSLETKVVGGGYDGLSTRDFLGVGQIVMRNVNGGVGQRSQRNLETEKNGYFGVGGNFDKFE
jgi:hypothetical protein